MKKTNDQQITEDEINQIADIVFDRVMQDVESGIVRIPGAYFF